MSRVHCLSLHQPWASLIAIGAKRIETRSWSTSYRGPLAIHAAKTRASIGTAMGKKCFFTLRNGGAFGHEDRDGLPFGGIVAVAYLVACETVESVDFTSCPEHERAFGDFTPGRFAWVLSNVHRVDPMIPLVGRQGLWTIDTSILPEGILF